MSSEGRGIGRGFGGAVSVQPPSAFVDFNDLHEGRLIVSLADLTGLLPGPGDPIVLTDDDGNVCSGRVEETSETYLLVRPLWETWVSARRELAFPPVASERGPLPIPIDEPVPTTSAGDAKASVLEWTGRWA